MTDRGQPMETLETVLDFCLQCLLKIRRHGRHLGDMSPMSPCHFCISNQHSPRLLESGKEGPRALKQQGPKETFDLGGRGFQRLPHRTNLGRRKWFRGEVAALWYL